MKNDPDFKALLDSRSAAIWDKDLERLLGFYSSDVIYFDIVPPLQYVGIDALRGRFTHWFEGFDGPIGQEFHSLTIEASADIAIASMLIRASGRRSNGISVSFFVRATSSFRRLNNKWLIKHEHVSLPVDLATGQAAILNLFRAPSRAGGEAVT